MNTKKFTQIALALVLAIMIVSGVRYVFAGDSTIKGWTPATGTPPTNNTDTPINIGAAVQNKIGTLNLGAISAYNGYTYTTSITPTTLSTGAGIKDTNGYITSYTNLLKNTGIDTYALIARKNAQFMQNVFITGNTGIGTTAPGADLEIKDTGTYTKPDASHYTGGQLIIGNSSNGAGARLELGYNTAADNAFINAGNYYPSSGSGPRTLILQPDGGAVTIGGTIKISGGTPGVGKVLTSDATGLASWGTPGSGPWTDTGTYVKPTTSSENVGANAYCDINGANCINNANITDRFAYVTRIYDNTAHYFLPHPTTSNFFGSICKVFVNGYVSNNATHIEGEYTLFINAPDDYDHSLYISESSPIRTIIDAGSSYITFRNSEDPTITVKGSGPALEVKTLCY
ncbi:MAG TPA: hypothetical protein VMR49_02210 [Candidatus Paceibacterota bacterium]|jgi:hypothetical protein|nr:hypothetical protein [Candidatus Paceibacterota bacterium]